MNTISNTNKSIMHSFVHSHDTPSIVLYNTSSTCYLQHFLDVSYLLPWFSHGCSSCGFNQIYSFPPLKMNNLNTCNRI